MKTTHITDEVVEAHAKAYIEACMGGLWEAFSEEGRRGACRDMRIALEGLAAMGWTIATEPPHAV